MISNEIQTELPKSVLLTHQRKFLLEMNEKDSNVKFDISTVYSYLPIIFNYLQNENEEEACFSIYALKNTFQIILSREGGVNSFMEYVLNPDFLSFLFHKISSDFVHPFFLKNVIKIFKLIIENIPQSIDQLLENDLSNILISHLPNKYASKCIIALIRHSDRYKEVLFRAQFHKQILRMIENLSQMNTLLRYYFEKFYVDILIELNSYFNFDEADYDIFLTFFKRNFSPKKDIYTQSQKSYINFLLKSPDPVLKQRFVCFRSNLIFYLLNLYGKPAYTKVRAEVLAYFELIIKESEEFAAIFTGPNVSYLINNMFNQEETLISISSLIFTICSSSYEICKNLINSELFHTLNFHFRNSLIEAKKSIYNIFSLLLRCPPNSPFYQLFADPNLFDANSFFEYIDMVLQIESDNKNDALLVINTLLEYISLGESQEFLNKACEHILSNEFYSIIQACIESDDKDFGNYAKAIMQKIEKFE